MPIPEPEDFILRDLEPGDTVTGFSLGSPEFTALKTFLRRNAKTYHAKNIGRTIVLTTERQPCRVWGYITLVCSEIRLDGDNLPDDCDGIMRHPEFPAVKIARCAVVPELRKQDYGSALVQFSIARVKRHIMPQVGCRFLVVDSKPTAVGFYERVGFTMLDTEENRANETPVMYIDLHKLK